jgi:hypothetical protein
VTVREKKIYQKVKEVINELKFDYEADIKGCSGEELRPIDAGLEALNLLNNRLDNYLSGKVDNPRGVRNGEKPTKFTYFK